MRQQCWHRERPIANPTAKTHLELSSDKDYGSYCKVPRVQRMRLHVTDHRVVIDEAADESASSVSQVLLHQIAQVGFQTLAHTVRHTINMDDAIEVVILVLKQPSLHPLQNPGEQFAIAVGRLHPDTNGALYWHPHFREGGALLVLNIFEAALFKYAWVHKDRPKLWCGGFRITNHDTEVHSYLWSRQSSSTGCVHHAPKDFSKLPELAIKAVNIGAWLHQSRVWVM
mmetsp:Transcript_133436/g.259808  ORF Transcript_133436/g.259808 Transcript_133436/m.259808 type:complete len:227 (+) Transcript_133436:48-728(+)